MRRISWEAWSILANRPSSASVLLCQCILSSGMTTQLPSTLFLVLPWGRREGRLLRDALDPFIPPGKSLNSRSSIREVSSPMHSALKLVYRSQWIFQDSRFRRSILGVCWMLSLLDDWLQILYVRAVALFELLLRMELQAFHMLSSTAPTCSVY